MDIRFGTGRVFAIVAELLAIEKCGGGYVCAMKVRGHRYLTFSI